MDEAGLNSMKLVNVSTIIGCVALLTSTPVYFANAVETLSESDLGDMSIESGDILNVMGAPAASAENRVELSGSSSTTYDNINDIEPGQSADPTEDSRLKSTQYNVTYIETDQDIEQQVDSTITPQSYNEKDVISTVTISERSDGKLGSSTIYLDEKDHHMSASEDDGVLTITQDVQVRQVHIHQPRRSPTSMPRGDRILTDIKVNSSVSISER